MRNCTRRFTVIAACAAVFVGGCGEDGGGSSGNTGGSGGKDGGTKPGTDSGAAPGSDAGGKSGNDAGAEAGDSGTPLTPDGGAGKLPAIPSTGCGLTNPVDGDRPVTVSAGTSDFIVSLPTNYDPMK